MFIAIALTISRYLKQSLAPRGKVVWLWCLYQCWAIQYSTQHQHRMDNHQTLHTVKRSIKTCMQFRIIIPVGSWQAKGSWSTFCTFGQLSWSKKIFIQNGLHAITVWEQLYVHLHVYYYKTTILKLYVYVCITLPHENLALYNVKPTWLQYGMLPGSKQLGDCNGSSGYPSPSESSVHSRPSPT